MSSQLPAQYRNPHQVSKASAFTSSSFPTRPGSPILITSRSEESPTAEDHALLSTGEELTEPRQVISIDTLPDDALLVIFGHYLDDVRRRGMRQNVEMAWRLLVHVCRRWRSIVFQSPRRLDLRLLCTGGTPARDRLDIWPTLPLIIEVFYRDSIRSVDNIIAALERTDRVCKIDLVDVSRSDMEMVLAEMQQPFPELTHLQLRSNDETVPVPDSFLGGSAPRLERLTLNRVPFQGLLKLLLSATRLVILQLYSIPYSRYFPPDAIATVLSTLTSLEHLELEFISTRSFPDRESQRPILSTRSVLPALTTFWFKGVSEYLEDLVDRIDAPQLKKLLITFFNDIVFDTPQLTQFISHTPMFKALDVADIVLSDHAASVNFPSQTSPLGGNDLMVQILCKGLDWQLSSLEQVCTSCLPPISILENLFFSNDEDLQADWKDNIDNELWVGVLRPFSAVKNLYLSEKVASLVAPALQELVGGVTEVLPTVLPNLQDIFVEGLESSGPVQEGFGQFVAARQVAGHPIAVSRM